MYFNFNQHSLKSTQRRRMDQPGLPELERLWWEILRRIRMHTQFGHARNPPFQRSRTGL